MDTQKIQEQKEDEKKLPFATRLGASILKYLLFSLRRTNPPKSSMYDDGVVALWHEEVLGVCSYFRDVRIVSLISSNKVSSILALYATRLGNRIHRGSTGKSPVRSLLKIIRTLKKGEVFLNAVDGSRGPRRKLKPGLVMIAQKTGKPVFCMRCFYSGFRLNTWDKMLIPRPFSKLTMMFSEPIYISKDDDVEEKVKYLEKVMEDLETQYNQSMGLRNK